VGRGQVYVPFQLSDLKEIKKDLGSYGDNPDQYIQAFITVIQTFELVWKDIMLLLDQTLSSLEKQWVLTLATWVEDNFHLQCFLIPVAPGNEGIEIPFGGPSWDQNDGRDEWMRCHFIIHLRVEGLKRTQVKPLNYSQVTGVQQGPDENPFTFL
jgi:hypothetical protein